MWGRLREIFSRAVNALEPGYRSTRLFDWRPYRNNISPDKALTLSAVWACTKFITGNISQLPWKVYRPTPKKPHNPYPESPVSWVLDRRANPEMSAAVWRELMVKNALLDGNCYSEIQRDNGNRVIALWPIEPWRVDTDRTESGDLFYKVDQGRNAEPAILQPQDMFHVPGLGDGVVGFGVIEYAARSMGLAINADEYGLGFFGNSGVPSGVLRHPGKLSDPAAKRLRESMETFRGSTRSGKTLLLEEGMEWIATSLPPEQSQFLMSRQFSVEDVCRWFGVPPNKIGHMTKSSYNAIEQIAIEVVVDCLMPWIKKFEQEADYKLLGDNRAGLYTKLDVRGLMRGTHADRAAYYRGMFSIGAYSINDILEREDMDPVPDGDLHMVPLNMTPLEIAVKGKQDQNNSNGQNNKKNDPGFKDNPQDVPGGPPKVARKYLESTLKGYGFDNVEELLEEVAAEAAWEQDEWDGDNELRKLAQ